MRAGTRKRRNSATRVCVCVGVTGRRDVARGHGAGARGPESTGSRASTSARSAASRANLN
eukprot:3986899-Prymnesium_polylepis.1